MIRLSNGVISKAYYVHANIIYLIDEAVNMDQNFMSYPVVKCREVLMQMAKQELAEMAPSGRVLSMVADTPDNSDSEDSDNGDQSGDNTAAS